ncbi:MAG TPA: hypothetical protein VEP48_12710 [Methylomirabilota bacterium]|nr:hypothetical protein [Methylomirabilota bacterium]
MSRQTMENATLRTGKGFIADEVIEASPQARGDDLKGAKGGTNQAGFNLTDEALGQLVTRELRLTHTERVARGADPLAQGDRLLNCFWQTRHRRSPV